MSFIIKSLSDKFQKTQQVLNRVKFALVLRSIVGNKENCGCIGIESSIIRLVEILLIKKSLKEQ